MEKLRAYIDRFPTYKAVIYFIIIYCVGLGLSYFEITKPLFQFLIPINILFSLGVLFLFHKENKKQLLISFFCVAFLSFLIEGIGVNTGEIFGSYTYETALGIKFWNTPLMIGVNWFLLLYCTQSLARQWTDNKWLVATLGATLMIVYDFVLEPIAVYFHFWRWDDGFIPLQNYIAWFLIAWFFHMSLQLFSFFPKNRLAQAIFFIQFGFFILLHFLHYIPFWG